MPKFYEWYTYHEWNKKYGDVVHISVLGQSIVVLGSHDAALDMLVKRAAIASDRPEFTMAGKVVGWEPTVALSQYDLRLRNIRRWFSLVMGTRSSTHLWDVEEHMTRRFLRKVYNDLKDGDHEGNKLAERIRWNAGAVILRIAYGYPVAEKDDHLIDTIGKAMDAFSQAITPGVWAVDFIPALRHLPSWFPFTSFKELGKQWSALTVTVTRSPLDFVKKQIIQGIAPFSFTRDLLEEAGPQVSAQEESDIMWAANSLYGGGSDTSVALIYSFFLLMTLHPGIQNRAQLELDQVLNGDRLPTLQDRQNGTFPYLDALVKEVTRWAPVVPASIPHVIREEDEYRGWRIPKGSFIIANLWGISRDPAIYPSPDTFRPERFLTKAQGGDCETEDDLPLDPRKINFGYGKRSCPGQHLAELSIWLSAAMALSVFNINAIEGQEPSPYEHEPGIIAHPKAFKTALSVRSEKAEELLKSIPDHDVTAWMHPWPKKDGFAE
ncbi:cytochrome P450 [Sistotremastrum niveocremeum HHB9708]|uniref:Cytochrome P450 n=2 Tax=Sistotremastraceae TaxID=3402574 RepID=A0A164S1U9_9AGAM|nr:cytochrome P450 [Sistotremastrum niveocremeum HHB9708]KZT40922.1 cytochrome P450 [Sistotremastrum suecicum HHB10207 ss-3]